MNCDKPDMVESNSSDFHPNSIIGRHIVLAALLLTGCTSSLPVMDAFIRSGAAVDLRATVINDQLTDKVMLDDTATGLNNSSLYNYPINTAVRFTIGDRVEAGGWLLGGYGKVMVLKPDSSGPTLLSNTAVSLLVSSSVAGLVFGGHQSEFAAMTGILAGAPLSRSLSLSTGLLYGVFLNSTSYMDIDGFVDYSSVILAAKKQKLIIPFNLTYEFGKRRRYLGYVGANLPFDLHKSYTLKIIYSGDDSSSTRSLNYHSRINPELRAGIALPLW